MAVRAIRLQIAPRARVERRARRRRIGEPRQARRPRRQAAAEETRVLERAQLVVADAAVVEWTRFICAVWSPSVPPAAKVWQRLAVARLGKYVRVLVVAPGSPGRSTGNVVGRRGVEEIRLGLGLVPLIAVAVPTVAATHEEAGLERPIRRRIPALEIERELLHENRPDGEVPCAVACKPIVVAGRNDHEAPLLRPVRPERRCDVVRHELGRGMPRLEVVEAAGRGEGQRKSSAA